MNVKKEAVHNAANLAFFMVNVLHILLEKFRANNDNRKCGIRDFISHHWGIKYFNETLKLLLKLKSIENVTSIGFIHV
ncbi:MAG: hypothetical protein H7263_14415 [Candidatus Sericytochromatia bacterium]|nr:hypothetical protein [Candidatus Sericytochromatia bacterium]